MNKPSRNYYREWLFTDWLRCHRLRREGVTFIDFQIRCEAGEVAGLSPEDFRGPSSAETEHAVE